VAKKLRVGIIGVGWPGVEHLKGYVASGRAKVVAVCDLDDERRERVAAEHNVPEAYSDYKKMLREAELDAVSNCLPNFLHAPVTLDALKAGKHVLCEKPPAMNAREAARMAALAKRKKLTLMYALCLRFAADSQLIHDYVDRGELGEVYFGKCGYVRRRGIPIGAGGWFVDKKRAGGGALIDIGVHALDRCWWLMGCPKPVAVLGSAYQKFRHVVPKGVKFDVDDAAFALIKFANGATLMLEATWALNLPGGGYCEIAGTKGGARLSPLTIFTERDGMQMDITPQVKPINGMEGETAHFVDCCLKGKRPIMDGEQGVLLMKMLDGIYTSQEMGREVRL
jgi:predicted dehydrogenase